jgi:uncharacterized protein (TIGR02302 family)
MLQSLPTESRPGWSDRIERRIALARAAILWEGLWPALWPASGIVALWIAAALSGVLTLVPAAFRILIFLGALGAAAYYLHRNLRGFPLPAWQDGARRLERDSALRHRPITERDDRLAAGWGDELAESLWRAHVRALLAQQHRLRFVLPKSALAARDPYRLRWAALLLLILAAGIARSEWASRLGGALSLGQSAPAATLEAWINPPDYTGEAPVYLPRQISAREIAVPAGSMLALRVHGGGATPQLTFAPHAGRAPAFAGQREDYSANAKIAADETVSVNAGGAQLAQWRIRAIPDEPPAIAFAQPPGRTEHDAVKFAFTAGDDYGVTAVHAVITPVKKFAKSRKLVVDLPLSVPGKTVADTVYRDLTGDPFAGLAVNIVLEARDAAGHVGRSNAVQFTLPARVFTNPLARALVEQRQRLFLDGFAGRNPVGLALDALTLAPERFYQNATGAWLSIRAAYWGLKNARHADELTHVEDLLWQTALGLERGGLSSAAEELRRLQQMISQALAQGAPREVIDSLLQRYQQALNQYLQMLARNPPPANAPVPKGAKVLKPQDLQALLNAIQQLSQTGARGQAQQLLAMLQSLLEDLHMTAVPGAGGQQDKALSDAVKGLGDLMGKQRQLLDKTFREREGNPDPKDGGPKGLSGQQGSLHQQLDKLLKGLGPKAGGGAKDLGEAGKQMGQAQGKLGEHALDDATAAERNALDAMRKGAGQLAKQMMQQNGQQQGEAGNDDPLGRENGGRGPSFGDQTKLPGPSQMERARSILKELRRRAEERGRPKEELDYIDRLLKQF